MMITVIMSDNSGDHDDNITVIMSCNSDHHDDNSDHHE